jgi:hypothetical protein
VCVFVCMCVCILCTYVCGLYLMLCACTHTHTQTPYMYTYIYPIHTHTSGDVGPRHNTRKGSLVVKTGGKDSLHTHQVPLGDEKVLYYFTTRLRLR